MPAAPPTCSLAGIGGCDFLYDPPPSTSTSATLDPGQEILNRYQTTASALNALAFVRNPASGLRDDSFVATIDSSGFVEVDQVGATASARPQGYLQPFADSSHGNMAWIYTTNFSYSGTSTSTAPVYTRDLVVRTFYALEQHLDRQGLRRGLHPGDGQRHPRLCFHRRRGQGHPGARDAA